MSLLYYELCDLIQSSSKKVLKQLPYLLNVQLLVRGAGMSFLDVVFQLLNFWMSKKRQRQCRVVFYSCHFVPCAVYVNFLLVWYPVPFSGCKLLMFRKSERCTGIAYGFKGVLVASNCLNLKLQGYRNFSLQGMKNNSADNPKPSSTYRYYVVIFNHIFI
jgi:hypothetical protein